MKKAIVTLDEYGAITLPEHIISGLQLQTGDELEIILSNGCIIIQPVRNEWLEGEEEAQKDIDTGNVKRFSSIADALRYLHDD